MPFNGSGVWAWNYNWVNDAANGIPITASRMDAQFDDAGNNGFDNCLTRDGQGIATANTPWGGFKITGLGVATALGDALSYANLATVSRLVVSAGTSTSPINATSSSVNPVLLSLTNSSSGQAGLFLTSNTTNTCSIVAGSLAGIAFSGSWTLVSNSTTVGTVASTGVTLVTPTFTGTTTAAAATFSGTVGINGGTGATFAIKASSTGSDGGLRLVSNTNTNIVGIIQDAGDDGLISVSTGGTVGVRLRATVGIFIGSGKTLQLGSTYVATPQVTSGYVTILDSTGTTYKVLVAA